ncbi:MAG: response regulator [Phycisphaerales bacterium]|nr:response regulator [Phycisphaerales bacterium]MCB9858583.1 response regulator [Phycisphaerales bacterium]
MKHLTNVTERLENIPTCDRVLVVEDVAALRDIWQRALKEMGLFCVCVRTGEEAVEYAGEIEFGIAMLDLNLPGIPGLELFRQLRALQPDIAVIVITGFGTLEAAQTAIRLGVVEFLTKPCGLGELEVAIDRARRRFMGEMRPRAPEQAVTPPVDSTARPATTMTEVERQTILEALERNEGNRTMTAKELGISIRTLYYRLAEYQREGFLP